MKSASSTGQGEVANGATALGRASPNMNTPTHTHRHYPIMVVGVTSRPHSVPLRVHGSFLHHLEMAAPSQPQRAAMLTALARENHLSPEIDFEDLAKRTAGFVLGDFVALFSHASHLAFRDVTKHW